MQKMISVFYLLAKKGLNILQTVYLLKIQFRTSIFLLMFVSIAQPFYPV